MDPRQALAAVRRALAATPAQLAGGLQRVVRDSPDEWLEQMMQTPARRVVLEVLFWQLSERLDSAAGSRISALIRCRITGRSAGLLDVYEVELGDDRCRVVRGLSDRDPRLTIIVDIVELLRIAAGDSDPLRAYMRGGIAVSGDAVLAARLAWMLRGGLGGNPPHL